MATEDKCSLIEMASNEQLFQVEAHNGRISILRHEGA